MTAQSWQRPRTRPSAKLPLNPFQAQSTHRIPSQRAVQDRVQRADLVSPDVLLAHLALHELLVREEVHAVASRLAQEGDALALEDARDAVLAEDFRDRVAGAFVDGICSGLRL